MPDIEENLIGYLLGALDADTMRHVESVLASDPIANHKLELLRIALAPLEVDRDEFIVPDSLAVRTIGLVAEYVVNNEPRTVAEPKKSPESTNDDDWFDPLATPWEPIPTTANRQPPRPSSLALTPSESPNDSFGWRRSNVFVAITLLLIVGGLSLPMIHSIQRRSQVSACQNNLRELFTALSGYAEVNNGRLPMIGNDPRHNTASAFVPILVEAQQWPGNLSPCPASLHADSVAVPSVPSLSNSYAYPLGYRDDHQRLHGVQIDPNEPDTAYLPVGADRFSPTPAHGNGQNVLFLNGNVRFCSTPNVGVNGDPIYINDNGRVKAGTHRWDSVLGSGTDTP